MHFELDDSDKQQSQNTQNASITPPTDSLNSPQITNPVHPTDNYQIIAPTSVKSAENALNHVNKVVNELTQEEKNLLVPTDIKTVYNQQRYNPEIMQSIILDIATTADPVDAIIKKHKQAKTTVYMWRGLSVQLMNAWNHAMKLRTHVKADTFEDDVTTLDTAIDGKDADYRIVGNKIRRFDKVWHHREWFLSRYNRDFFGDKVEVDNNLTISPAKARDDAYNAFQANPPTDADYDVITVPQDLNRITDLTDGNDNESNRATDG